MDWGKEIHTYIYPVGVTQCINAVSSSLIFREKRFVHICDSQHVTAECPRLFVVVLCNTTT